MEELSRQYDAATSPSTPSFPQTFKQPKKPAPAPSLPSLKIKVAIPPSMLAKRLASEASQSSSPRKSRSVDEMMSVGANAGEHFAVIGASSGTATPTPSHPQSHIAQPPNPPRKRGRPRKIIPAARDLSVDSITHARRESTSTSPVHRRSNPKTNIIGRTKHHQMYAQKFAKTLKARVTAVPNKLKASLKSSSKKKAPAPKRRQRIDSESSLSELTDDDGFGGHSRAYDPDSEGDSESVQFPTFVSASALSSMDSDGGGISSDSSLSGFDSDASIEKEEEDFIVSEMQDKSRISGDHHPRRREQTNEWVIRPRRHSPGLSGAEIEVDSDATEEDDEDDGDSRQGIQVDGEAQEDEDEDEPDGRPAGGRGCFKGLVTGWSDGEESSFDADIFFANLTSGSDHESSDDEAKESAGMRADDDDETSSDISTEAELLHMREELENLPLELAEGWDGQMMFTNGTLAGQAIIDIDFEVNASQFVTDHDAACKNGQCSSSRHDHDMAHEGHHSDVEMSSGGDDGGYEEDAGEGEGDTTDEELVGDDDLPNERAMRLFNFPLSVSAINPLSTVSPAVTPSIKRPRPRIFSVGDRVQSPSPADILAGRLGWDSADEMDELFDNEQRDRRLARGDGVKSEGDSIKLGPRKGIFIPTQEAKKVVIDGSQKEVPSPHPRFNNRRRRRLNTVEALLRKHLYSVSRPQPSFIPAATVVPDSSPLKLLPSVEITASASAASALLHGGSHQDEDTHATPIDLDDVFESSLFHPDPNEASSSVGRPTGSAVDPPPDSATTADESDSNNRDALKHLHRWDVISVGAFRQTRENAASAGILESPTAPGWPSDHRRTPASSADYGNVLKASPLSTMLWPTNDKGKKASRQNLAVSSLANSPMILATRSDGDRTPTKNGQHGHHQQQQQQQQQNKYVPKTRKELRKERKLKRKANGHSPHTHHPSHHYHSHHHHPNSKSRSSGSVQRTNFFLPSVPSLNL
ncbi:hypothetical protein EST38_g3463 [Candolleomyces aberdarensis]|uniref:Uncharacterized protein n=1 Tax=Candolleomyces aberdarensis TaxID=2316362 RepID=A0A4Q2DQQ6_9AGAR|nr:hypothetical protein EST38_g3463 [Candolleomyces aberdarensis]